MENEDEHLVAVKYRDVILAKQKEYYQKNKEKTKEKSKTKRLNMSEEKKQKLKEKDKIGRDNMSFEKKQQLNKYMRIYNKNRYHNHIVFYGKT